MPWFNWLTELPTIHIFPENRSPVRFTEIDENCMDILKLSSDRWKVHIPYYMYTAHARTCTAHELQKFMYCAGNSMVRKNAPKNT